MKGKILSLCAALFLTTATAFAQDTMTALVLERIDGTKTTFLLADNPIITISDGELTARSPKEEVTVPIDGLLNYHFEQAQTGISDVAANEDFILRDGVAYFTNLEEGSQVNIFALDGREIARVTVPEEGDVVLDLNTMERGIIIIRTGNYSYKVNNMIKKTDY